MSDELEIRSADLEYREEAGEGVLEGIAVPWDQTVTIRNADGTTYQERFERGSVELDGTVWLYDSHRTPIGVVEAAETRDDGLFVRAKFALSDLAKSVYQRLKAGALNKLSVGFSPIDQREEGGVIVRTLARLREVSVVERPAYPLATVLAVRSEGTPDHEVPNAKEKTVTDTVDSGLIEVREEIEELRQEVSMLPEKLAAPPAPKVETRSAGEILQAIAERDEDTIAYVNEVYSRAYTGGTSADSPIQDAWVGDLTRIFDASSGVLSAIFAKGTLPEKGMSVEFAKLNSNSVTVTAQSSEGDDLAFGKVTLTTDTAPVNTYGGYTQLTLQEIRRSTLPILNRHLEALAVAAGARKKATLRSVFGTVRGEQITDSNTVTLGEGLDDVTPIQWADLIVDAAMAYEEKNAIWDALVVSPAVFKHLNSLTISGDKVFKVASANTLGSLNLPGLTGDLAGVPVVCDTGATGAVATFVNGRAIRQYNSGIVNLQDENTINLSRTFSVYYFEAIAEEEPDLIVPVVIPADD